MTIKVLLTHIGTALLGAVVAAVLVQTTTDQPLDDVPRRPVTVSPSSPTVAVTGNEDIVGDRSLFHFSPNKQHIAFMENVFAEHDNDYDRYWTVTVFDVTSLEEHRIFIGTYKTSGFEWVDNDTIRVFLNAGTGVRAYRDVTARRSEPVVVEKYMDRGEAQQFWTPDQEYVEKAVNIQRAEQTYRELSDR